MADLITDFVRDGGTYMILTAKDGLHSGQINRTQRAMLYSVSVPNLLRLDVKEVDFQVSLHYEITGRRMLSQCLKQDKIGMAELYSLLLQVVTVLDDSKQYMLSPMNFIMDENHIFVEEPLSAGILYFTYVPIMEFQGEGMLAKSLLTLITKIIPSVAIIEGNGIQQLLRFCSSELFSVTGLKKIIIDLLAEDHPSSSDTLHREVTKPAVLPQVTIKEYMPLQAQRSNASSIEPAVNVGFNPESSLHSGQSANNDAEAEESEVPAPKRTYILLGSLLATALCWKFLYLDQPASYMLYICLVLTLLFGVGGVLLWKGRLSLPGRMQLASTPSESIANANGMENNFQENEWRWNQPRLEMPADYSVYEERQRPASSQDDRDKSPIRDLGPARMAQPQTVLLSRDTLLDKVLPDPTYSLERVGPEQGQPESIPLQRGSFVVGRSEGMAQYVEKSAGVSRAHVELMVLPEGCSLKDLGSKNGTRLRGEMMAPYKDYPLNPGDSFVIADCSFTLRTSGRQVKMEYA